MSTVFNTSIVIPCYNEEKGISNKEYSNFLNNNPEAFICFVNDGSKDNTLAVRKASLAPGAKVMALSSRMGSIGARESSSSWLYRASKAALNSLMKDTSLAWAGRAICVCAHPGWVRTDMGGASADLSVQQSVTDLRRVIEGLVPADNGSFLNHDGFSIPW